MALSQSGLLEAKSENAGCKLARYPASIPADYLTPCFSNVKKVVRLFHEIAVNFLLLFLPKIQGIPVPISYGSGEERKGGDTVGQPTSKSYAYFFLGKFPQLFCL